MSTLARGLKPRRRSTSQLRASMHERMAGTVGTHELAEIERRMADLLAANARGNCSAADVVAALYEQGWGRSDG